MPGAPSLTRVTDEEELRARFTERRLEIMTKPDRDAVRDFMSEFVYDWGGEDELRTNLRHAMHVNLWRMGHVLRSFKTFMADPPRDGTMMWLVEHYGNWSVEYGPRSGTPRSCTGCYGSSARSTWRPPRSNASSLARRRSG